MAQSMTSMFRDGQEYMNIWPVKKELYAIFPECRVISATRLAIKTMPPMAVLACAMMINTFGAEYLPQAIAIGAFFLSLPMQGLLWLGHRSNQLLPPQLRSWYQEVHSKMRAEGCAVQSLKSRPQYRELASLLKTAFSDLDRMLTRHWFQ
ncbi:DUF412 domain-containing protein [Alteromonas pelagimontana]|uniref:UPF0208 membrane protein YfbV n=1 Tax=Alteromonas pelagimontana TaxID=1858656 RepID=A0A6M4MK04_9ALTE|nr:terminus macrodomain insulation protein YfbV [Alteromonas pelagimontana]QJR82426.1 DUF412 domain-containing protein [Alteromonas pelagimontana]